MLCKQDLEHGMFVKCIIKELRENEQLGELARALVCMLSLLVTSDDCM